LVDKHLKLLDSINVDIQYDLDELEKEFFDSIDTLKKLTFIDGEVYFNKALKEGKKILAEGAQGSLLDINFGTYPYVTSSTTTAAGVSIGLGIPPTKINKVFGVFKAYTTRVGSGPFPTELFDETGTKMAKVGHEFGATTGRPRRCGWLDLVALKYAVDINGATNLMMMKSDVLSGFKELKAATKYNYLGQEIQHFPFNIDAENVQPIYSTFKSWNEDLEHVTKAKDIPQNLLEYIKYIENFVGVPVKVVSVGPDRKQTIVLE
jgi:adenylosuccinate synthase